MFFVFVFGGIHSLFGSILDVAGAEKCHPHHGTRFSVAQSGDAFPMNVATTFVTNSLYKAGRFDQRQ